MSLKDIEEELSHIVEDIENDVQPIIDRANQVDSVIVTVAIMRLTYRLIKNGYVRCVTWLRERRHENAEEDTRVHDNTSDDGQSH